MTMPQIAPASGGISAIESRVSELRSLLDRFSGRVSDSQGAAAEARFAGSLAKAMGLGAPQTVGLGDVAHASGGGEAIVAAAKQYLGVPYVFGGEDRNGMDCSGLVQRVFADLGVEVPRLVRHQQHLGTEVGSLAEAQPGDLIVTHNADHIVIYAGEGQIIHAPYAGRTVSLQPNYLTDADIKTIRRVAVPGFASVAEQAPRLPLVSGPATSADAAAAVASLLGGTAGAGAATNRVPSLGASLIVGAAGVSDLDGPLHSTASAALRSSEPISPTPPSMFATSSALPLEAALEVEASAPAVAARGAHPPLTEQLGRPILALASRAPGEHTVTLSVQPEQLGPVTVRANIGVDGIRIELLAPEQGREALRGMLGDLRRELGLIHAGARLELSDGSGGSASGHGPRDGAGTFGDASARDALSPSRDDVAGGSRRHGGGAHPGAGAAAAEASATSAETTDRVRPGPSPSGLGATIDLLT